MKDMVKEQGIQKESLVEGNEDLGHTPLVHHHMAMITCVHDAVVTLSHRLSLKSSASEPVRGATLFTALF